MAGHINLKPDAWDTLQPGPQPIPVVYTGPGVWYIDNETLQATCILLPRGQPSVTLYHDDVLAAQIQKSLTCAMTDAGEDTSGSDMRMNLTIETTKLPVDLAMDVIVKAGDRAVYGGMIWFRKSWSYTTAQIVLPDVHNLVGKHGDVILRPSIAAAACTMDMFTLLDHEFIFKDVPFVSARPNTTEPAH